MYCGTVYSDEERAIETELPSCAPRSAESNSSQPAHSVPKSNAMEPAAVTAIAPTAELSRSSVLAPLNAGGTGSVRILSGRRRYC